jgi:division protein CdvB (Snf7/Vps24/ESCRT-III family)
MTAINTISDKLKQVLRDMEKMTNDIETIQAQVQTVANDDFLTRDLQKPMDA